MVEHAINLEKYGYPERCLDCPVKNEYHIPRTREAWEEKSVVYFKSKNSFEGSIITRKVEDFCLPTLIGFNFDNNLTKSDIHIMAWNVLKERGFKVVPTVRKIDENTVATTNLSADEITSVYDQKIDALEVRDTFPMDKEFIKIPFEKIQKEADVLLNLANRSGVELMSDGPFHIVVQEDGSCYLMLLDIGKVRIYAQPKDMPNSVEKDNRFYISKALIAFSRIQKNIKALRDARGLK